YSSSLFSSLSDKTLISSDKIKSIKPLFTGNYATRANTEIFYFSQKAANLIINKKYDLNLLPDITQANGNKCTLLDLVNSLNDDYFSILIPQIKIDENNCTVDTSVLTDGVKQKIISKENTQSVNLLKGKISKNNFLIEVDNNKISVDVKDIKEKIEYDGENFIIKINGQSSLNEKSFNNTKYKKLIEKSQIELNKLIKNNIEKSIEELIKKNDFDPMNFYKYFRKYDYNIFKQNKNNWINFLKNSSFIIESNVYINPCILYFR
ncbi:MAG: Ger(x)C family spore germination C-terminal domain-containing protein, partial [Clostridia bacterium]